MSTCYSTAIATQYTTIATNVVSTSLSQITSTLPASMTTLTSSVCQPPAYGSITGTTTCRTVTSVSSLGGGTTTVQVPIVVTVTTTLVSPLSTLFSTTCSSSRTTATGQTTTQTTVSTSAVSAAATIVTTTATTTTSSRHRSPTVTTVIESSMATSAAANASPSGSDTTGVIVGAAVGGGIGLILVILLGWLLCRRRHRNKGDYIRADMSNQSQFDGGAMVRPTPYPYRDHSRSSGDVTGHAGRPQSYRKAVPAIGSPQTQTPSAMSPSSSASTTRPSGSVSFGGNIPTTSNTTVPGASAERAPARRVASEGTPSPPNPSRGGHRPRSGEGLGRSPPRREKKRDQIHLHPDRGLTVVLGGVEAPRSGPSVARDASSRGRNDVSSLARRPEWRVKGGGGQEAARDRQGLRETGAKDQSAATGMTREKQRRQEEHGGEESEGEAPPAYWE